MPKISNLNKFKLKNQDCLQCALREKRNKEGGGSLCVEGGVHCWKRGIKRGGEHDKCGGEMVMW